MSNDPTLARNADVSNSTLDGLASAFETQWSSGDRPQIQEYLSRAPADQRPELLARLMRLEMELQSQSGETFAVRNYREQFAEYSDVVESVLAEQSGSAVSGSHTRRANESTLGRTGPAVDNTAAAGAASSPSRRPGKASAAATLGASLIQFGDYEILSEIARGGMGVVYRARQIKLNRIVALKMILAGQFASEADVQRFYSEAEAAAKLDHPGIVPIYEVDEVEGRHYFSMSFVDGQSLQQRIAAGPLPPREAAQLVRQVAEAVHYAHQHGVIHRDLKPRNILLTSEGQPKVTDFGLAKRLGGESDLTVSGQAIGTPGYMPPEQAAGRLDEIGPQSDVYSLGGVLYCLLTGRPPFQSASVVETIKQAIETPPVPPRMLNPAIDRDLETVCLKCLEKEAAHRYSSAGDLAEELQRYLDGEPIRALRAGPVVRGWRWLKRRPLVAALATSLLVLALVIALSAGVAQRAITTYRLTNLQRSIEARLDAPELNSQWVTETDRLVASLGRYDPALPLTVQPRLNDALAGRIRAEIRRPKLDDQIVRSIETAIALVDPRDRALAQRLRGELGRRQRDWQTVFQLKAPFANAAEFLPAGAYQVDAQKRLLPQAAAPLLTRAASTGLVRCEARFDEGWEDAERLGIAINAQPQKGYDYVLEIDPGRTLTQEDLPTQASGEAPAQTFREVRGKDGYFRLAIYRNRRLLLGQSLHHSEVPSGPLTLSGSREQGELRIQVNTLAARLFRDPFPLPARQAGVFGLHWPAGVGLVELRTSEKLRATSVSPLEEGDELFEQGKLAEALEHYQQQARETDDPEFLQESLHKQGMCLMNLGRLDEAAAIFEPLLSSEGQRWPPLAGCHLWVIRLRQKREAEADAIFDSLSTRYRLDQFAALVPQELASEIRGSYQSKLGSLSSLIRYNADLVRDHQRLAAVDRFFSPDGRGDELTQMEVARAYHLLGDIPSALQAAEVVARGTRHGTVVRHYVRLLRLNGEAQRGLEELEKFRQQVAARENWNDLALELEWARVYAALDQMSKSEEVVDRLLSRHRLVEPFDPRTFVYIALIKGVHLDRRGARRPAEEVWREGYVAMQPLVRKQAEPNSEIINALILGSLCGEITDEECQAFASGMMARGGDNAFARQAQTMISPQTMAAALRQMWRTPLGRKYAEAFAFETLTLGERVRVPVVLTATEFVNQSVHGGQMTAEQQQIVFNATGAVFEQAIFEGKISISQVAQLILTWKGIANFLGWGGVAPSLDADVRGGMAYLFGHRYLALNNKAQAARFFEIAMRDAPPDSLLARMAAEDNQLLAEEKGRIIVSCSFAGKVQVSIRQGDKEVAVTEIGSGDTAIDVPAGECTLALTTPRDDCRLTPTTIRVAAGGRRQAELKWLWHPGPGEPLWGLIPRPATAAIGARWQLHFRYPAQETRYLAFSGEGDQFAAASADGTIRVFDAESRQLVAILSGQPHDVSGLNWAPSASRLVASGYDGPVSGWDMPATRQVFHRIEHRGPVRTLAAAGTQYLSSDDHRGLRLWSETGELTASWDDPDSAIEAAALSPDGRWAAVRSWSPAGFAVLRVYDLTDQNPPVDLNSQAESDYRCLAFSPDGQLLAAGDDARMIHIWRVAEWSRQTTIKLEGGQVKQLLWHPDSRHLLVPIHFREVAEVDVLSMPPEAKRRWPAPMLRWAALAPSGQRMIISNNDGQFLDVDLASGESHPFGSLRRDLLALSLQPGGKLIAAAGMDATLRLLDPQGRLVAWAAPLPQGGQINCLSWKPDGSLLAGVVNGRSVAVWRPDGSLHGEYQIGVPNRPQPLAWDAEGTRLVVIGRENKKFVIDLAAPSETAVSGGEDQGLIAVERTSSGQLVTTSARHEVQIVDAAGKVLHAFSPERRREIHLVSVSPQGDRLAILDQDGLVSLWMRDGKPLAELRSTHGQGERLAWSPDGRRVAVSTRNRALQIWTDSGELTATFNVPHGGQFTGIAWLDDAHIVTGGEDAAIRIWNVDDKQAEKSTILLDGGAWAQFDAGGLMLEASGSIDEHFVYSVETPQGTLELMSPSEFEARVASSRGSAGAGPAPLPLPPPSPAPVPAPPSPAERAAEQLKMTKSGEVKDQKLTEISGLARCATRAEGLWMHNDGGEPRLYLVDRSGTTLARYDLPVQQFHDWEDMAAFRREGQSYLLIGDIGDNGTERASLLLHLIKEPDAADPSAETVSWPLERTIQMRYEDGQYDCEALAVDGERNVALLLTKELDAECSLFEVPLDAGDQPAVAKRVARLPLPLVTAMDLSPDGRRLVVLGGVHAFEYSRAAGEKWTDALSRIPRRYTLPALTQPEAIAYDSDGKSLLVTSEGVNPPLWQLRLPAAE